jgi:hypothetical protein
MERFDMKEFQRDLEDLLNKYVHDFDGHSQDDIRRAVREVTDHFLDPNYVGKDW